MLYRPDWHEPLTERAWDEAWTRDAIAALVAEAVAAYDPDAFWPAEEWDAWGARLPLQDVYCGAAGMVWALARLEADFDGAAAATRIHERYVAPAATEEMPLPPQARSSLLGGETGVAWVRYALAPSDELRARLLELVRANLDNEANELMWGVPGTLLVARALGEGVAESEAALRSARDDDGWWTQHLYGMEFRSLGPVHGLLGNLFALGEVESALPVLRERAVREGGHVNWLPGPGDDNARLQWCHGAPGIVIHAAHVLDEDLVLGGAQLTWDAGPFDRVEKGAGLCHGTAGNGYALLRTFERTRDELWLHRARAFATHALEQAQAAPRYSLFTGGIGAALYARDCLEGSASFPVLDWL